MHIEKDREVSTLQFVSVPYNAPSFTGSDDGYRSASLPSPFRFGNLSYSTAYVICILAMMVRYCNFKVSLIHAG